MPPTLFDELTCSAPLVFLYLSTSAVLGYPRIGPQREVKKALEAYWGGKTSQEELLKVAKDAADVKTETITVESKWHSAVVGKSGTTLNAYVLPFRVVIPLCSSCVLAIVQDHR